MRCWTATAAIDLVHRCGDAGATMQTTPQNADFVEQAVDCIEDFPAQFVIDLSSRSNDAGLRAGQAGFSTKLSTSSVGQLLR
jgi:hypothetical protein